MASDVDISNRALQRLGANSITLLAGDSVEARECNRCYAFLRDAELRAHPWSFAKKRVNLAKSTTAPAFEFANAFPLPADYLHFIRTKYDLDWQVENQDDVLVLLTNDADPLEFRYIAKITNSGLHDPLFDEALGAKMAMEMAEKLTQSNKKRELARTDYLAIINEARRVNAFERPPQKPVDDDWETVRR